MTYVLLFFFFYKSGAAMISNTVTAEYNSKAACEQAAAEFSNQVFWADRRGWSCSAKGEKK